MTTLNNLEEKFNTLATYGKNCENITVIELRQLHSYYIGSTTGLVKQQLCNALRKHFGSKSSPKSVPKYMKKSKRRTGIKSRRRTRKKSSPNYYTPDFFSTADLCNLFDRLSIVNKQNNTKINELNKSLKDYTDVVNIPNQQIVSDRLQSPVLLKKKKNISKLVLQINSNKKIRNDIEDSINNYASVIKSSSSSGSSYVSKSPKRKNWPPPPPPSSSRRQWPPPPPSRK